MPTRESSRLGISPQAPPNLQLSFIKFDTDSALAESDLMQFLFKHFKPMIETQIKQRKRELDSGDKLVEKVINTEAKLSLQPVDVHDW